MKRKAFLTVAIAFLAVCNMAFGQELKPLKSFDNDAKEYLKHNLEKGNTLFQGRSFGDIIDALEAKFLVAKIHRAGDDNSLYMNLYLQTPEYVNDRTLEERYLTGAVIAFENDNELKEATRKIIESFAKTAYGPMTVALSDENMDKLIMLLSNCKIRVAVYEEDVVRTVRFE